MCIIKTLFFDHRWQRLDYFPAAKLQAKNVHVPRFIFFKYLPDANLQSERSKTFLIIIINQYKQKRKQTTCNPKIYRSRLRRSQIQKKHKNIRPKKYPMHTRTITETIRKHKCGMYVLR